MPSPMDIIKQGLSTPATNALGLVGQGDITREQMQDQVGERHKGILPTPDQLKGYGTAVTDLFS